ncbi:GNAT family N-acetyltransferase [Nocardia mexicana]|uniref:Acetyltransferase (GNAT) family protein n=1 Tax=Nocardia mexicana TaxID=279262 RepID=A0A370GZD1_9NOCA|nr:GNAT family N-acetyltransferase [Nocardia mexicana]RDI49030.1 acetyltransferase (GNAT) family protein [Nocardia mexicana]
MRVVQYADEHLDGIVALCRAEGWPSYPADLDGADRALRAPGSLTLVAIDGHGAIDDIAVVGFAHALSDGWWGYLSLLLVAEHRRREGIGVRLVKELFRRSGVTRLDLITDEASEFYRSRPHTSFEGFRLYPRS